MSGDAHCEKLREAGAELALGVLPGRERAQAVAHLDECADCREYVRQLTGIGDRLIGLLPESEPPPGFETRVARSLAEQTAGPEGARRAPQHLRGRARRARLRLAAAAATLAVAVGFAGWGIGTVVEGAIASPPAAVESEPVLVGDMIPAGGGQPVGEVYAHPGSPAWMFVSVALPGAPYTGKVTCLLERADGTTTRVGDFPVRDGRGNWGVAVPVDLTGYSDARLTTADGTVLATAHLQHAKVVTPET
ncbi:zf-HC2 domain-containing protein [Streptomyces sp. NPDC007851]|uniref:zf-HC2 domain-containing protein n=1 Tax=Streptomyces sp. NPDC007851 TaxID=3155008 RepID=UPI00340E6A62